jgi:hypothetical protein
MSRPLSPVWACAALSAFFHQPNVDKFQSLQYASDIWIKQSRTISHDLARRRLPTENRAHRMLAALRRDSYRMQGHILNRLMSNA